MNEATLFIEKADKLERLSFYKKFTENSGVKFSAGIGRKAVANRFGPSEESIDSFILTFRYFIQDNEAISLRRMASVFESDWASEENTAIYIEARRKLNEYLDSNAPFDIGGLITHREVMDVFIYGGLSHANEAKKIKYDSWRNNTILFPFLENEFTKILNQVFYVIRVLRDQAKEMVIRNA